LDVALLLERLRRAHPDATCALHHKNPFELLIATILSAQCTDERVNLVTPGLFGRFPDPAAMSLAEREDLESIIKSTGSSGTRRSRSMARRSGWSGSLVARCRAA
jgi:endonuclease III